MSWNESFVIMQQCDEHNYMSDVWPWLVVNLIHVTAINFSKRIYFLFENQPLYRRVSYVVSHSKSQLHECMHIYKVHTNFKHTKTVFQLIFRLINSDYCLISGDISSILYFERENTSTTSQ